MQQLGAPLNRLIKDRSYTSGRISRLEARRKLLLDQLAEIEGQQARLDAHLSGVDAQIQALSRINVSQIRAIAPNEKISQAPHGHVMKGVVEFFRCRGDAPVRSDELQRVVAALSGYSLPKRKKLQQKTAHLCYVLKERGWLERLEDQAAPEVGRVYAVWRWVGNEVMNAVDKARGLHENILPPETTPAVVEPVR